MPNNSPVLLTYVFDQQLVFVRLATDPGKADYRKTMREIDEYAKYAEPFVDHPEKFQILLLQHSGMFYRVMALASYDSGPVLVARIDIGDILQVPQSSLFKLNDHLQKKSAHVRRIILNGVSNESRNWKQVIYLMKQIDRETEYIIKFKGDSIIADLYPAHKGAAIPISQHLKELEEPTMPANVSTFPTAAEVRKIKF